MVNGPLDLREAGQIAYKMLVKRWVPPTAVALDAALNHHDRILDDLAVLLRNGAHLFRNRTNPVTVAEIATTPARGLLAVLERQPRLGPTPEARPTELLNEENPAGGSWRDLNRSVLVAAHRWSGLVEVASDEVQWGLVADVAAISGAVAILERDLAEAVRRQGADGSRAALLDSSAAALALCAQVTLDVAVCGPTQDGWTPPPPASREVLPLVDQSDIPRAAGILAQTLHDARLRLDAAAVLELILTHARSTSMVSEFLLAAGQRETADVLKQHAVHLIAAAQLVRNRLWSAVRRPHEHPRVQARELNWAIGRHLRDARPTEELRRAVEAYVSFVPAITSGIRKQEYSARRRGDWAVLDVSGDHPAMVWRIARPWDLQEFSQTLYDASQVVVHLGPSVAHPETTSTNSPAAAYRVLLAAISDTERPRLPRIARPLGGHRRPPPTMASAPPRPPPNR